MLRLMHALVRKISPYTAADILLGVFSTESDAQRARDAYLAGYSADPSADPWREQAYKPGGLEAGDLQILFLEAPVPLRDGDDVIVVSKYYDMFGQILRELDSIHLSEAAAQARIAEIDRTGSDVPTYELLQRVRIGAVHSDEPDQQPHL